MTPWMHGILSHLPHALWGVLSAYAALNPSLGIPSEYAPLIGILVQQFSMHSQAVLQATQPKQ